MQFFSNRSISTGVAIALFSALSAVAGAPKGFDGFTIPVWDILLQFNLCTGFVFVILGVLETVETPTPDLRPALKLLATAFVAYAVVCLCAATPLALPTSIQLFLFAVALACLMTGWARFGISVLKEFDEGQR